MVWSRHISFRRSSVNGSASFHFLAVTDSASVNTRVSCCLCVDVFSFPLGIHVPRGGMAGSYGNSVINQPRSHQTVFQNRCVGPHPTRDTVVGPGPLGQLSVRLAVWADGVDVQTGCVRSHLLGVGMLVGSETSSLANAMTTTTTRSNIYWACTMLPAS